MDERGPQDVRAAQAEKDEQPDVVKGLLKGISAARRQCSLYGSEHQNTQKMLEELVPIIKDLVDSFGPSTFVFTRDAVLVNDRCYKSSADSRDLCQRLRTRGAMAVTFLQDAPTEHVAEFLAFLNTEPREIVQQGGPSAYLRRHAVTRIVATEAVYGDPEDLDAEGESSDRFEMDSEPADRAILAAIQWLTRQDREEEAPQLPIVDILSDPTKAGKLVREAVTKLHASRRSRTSTEIATQAINDMKDLTSSDPQKWDQATPQIRKAILKLPEGLRPAAVDFAAQDDASGAPGAASPSRVLDAGEVEAMVAEVFDSPIGADSSADASGLHDLGSLFGVKTSGLMSSWQTELQPASFIESSARTFATLMTWETSAAEHGRIAHALASLISRALEMNDTRLALELAGALVEEVNRHDELRWRGANAKSALQSLDLEALKTMVEGALESNDLRAHEVAASLVEIVSSLALSLINLLGETQSAAFNDSLKRGIARSGRAAAALLGRLLSEGSPSARQSALEVLVDMKSETAISEVEAVLKQADPAFLVKALDMLAGIPSPSVARVCVGCLRNRSRDVRRASLWALAKLNDESALPHLVRFAMRRGFGIAIHEQLIAIESLGHSGPPEVGELLARLVRGRPLIGRTRYDLVRASAEKAIAEIASRNQQPDLKVA
ncbi:MAG TPA: HEAT repeat domain-containing protein [Armatimonadota bacterium]|nr:HEAT repeat domain-containing protein [Armatimonadota bacterium]